MHFSRFSTVIEAPLAPEPFQPKKFKSSTNRLVHSRRSRRAFTLRAAMRMVERAAQHITSRFHVGDRVRHPIYGDGTVKALKVRDLEIEVYFYRERNFEWLFYGEHISLLRKLPGKAKSGRKSFAG